MYALNLSHSGIHQLGAALDLALAVMANDEQAATQAAQVFKLFLQGERKLVILKMRRELARAHGEAIEVDGHGDEFASSPLQGAELGDERDARRAILAAYDAKIAELEGAGPFATEGLDLGAGDTGSKWS